MEYIYLTKELQNKLDNAIEQCENYVNYEELNSRKWNSNPYDVEPELVGTSGCYEYDDDEVALEEYKILKQWIEKDGIENYIELSPELSEEQQDDETLMEILNKEAINYLETQIESFE